MAKTSKAAKPKARLPRGFRDIGPDEIRRMEAMLATIRRVYERYGFEPLETPAFEFTEALGKFLPDTDRPNAGVFSLLDEDDQWMSLRYDLTAPLARYVAENFQTIPKPFRRYQTGPVWRNEKPGPGRFRQFTQFDADTVGSDNIAADAEICMMAADTLEALGLEGRYAIKVNNRKVLDGMLQSVGIDVTDESQRLAVLRSLDKLDKFSPDDVAQLLGEGRKDASGDFTKGAGLAANQIDALLAFVSQPPPQRGQTQTGTEHIGDFATTPLYREGLAELAGIDGLVAAAGYTHDQIRIDYSVVRGLDYYTGPVFEAELTFEISDDKGRLVRFGSVGGGGRYDDLVARFTGQRVPATGFSIGVSRLAAALDMLDGRHAQSPTGPVVVLVMDKAELPRYQKMASDLRNAGIRSEMYVGTSNMKKQMQYADRRNAPCVVIQGETERDAGEIQIKDLVEGTRLSAEISDPEAWRAANPAQFSIAEGKLIEAVRTVLTRYGLDEEAGG